MTIFAIFVAGRSKKYGKSGFPACHMTRHAKMCINQVIVVKKTEIHLLVTEKITKSLSDPTQNV